MSYGKSPDDPTFRFCRYKKYTGMVRMYKARLDRLVKTVFLTLKRSLLLSAAIKRYCCRIFYK